MDQLNDFTQFLTARTGVLTRAQAQAHGFGDDVVAAAIKAGLLTRVMRGCYASLVGASSPEERHRLRARALAMRLGGERGELVASHDSALTVFGLPTYEAHLGTVHLARAGATRTRYGTGWVIHQLPEHTPTVGWCVTPAVAVMQTGLWHGPRAALVAADAALRAARPEASAPERAAGAADREELQAALALYQRAPGAVRLSKVLPLADPRHESPGESLLGYDLWLLGISVDPQVEIAVGGTTYRADFMVRGTRLLLEFDGLIKLDDPSAARRADERERALRRQGWVIVRFSWPDLGDLPAIAQRIADAAHAHGLAVPVAA